MKLIMIRHGETPWNIEHRVQGRTDTPLSERGTVQARQAGELLADVRLSAIYSSPLMRARDTALEIACRHAGLAPVYDDDITEINFGQWEGLTNDELMEAFPELWADWNWIMHPEICARIGAETADEIMARALRFIERLLLKHGRDDVIAVVSHTMPLKMIIAHFIGLPMARIRHIRLDNCGRTELTVESMEDGYLTKLNETAHIITEGAL